jgi:hypothetical protein
VKETETPPPVVEQEEKIDETLSMEKEISQKLTSPEKEISENLTVKDEESSSTKETKETKETNSEKLALIQADLAKRLDINPSTVGRRKSDPDFALWSQTKDPEGLAWKYVPKTKMFVPLEED